MSNLQRGLTLMVAVMILLGWPTAVMASTAVMTSTAACGTVTERVHAATSEARPTAVRIQHTWKQRLGGVVLDFSDESLGTIIGPDLILTHNHFTQPMGRLPDEAFIFEEAIGRSIRWRVSDVKLTVIDGGTLLIRLPAKVFPDIAPVVEAAALRRLAIGTWLTVSYWDDQAQHLAQHDFQITQIKDGVAKLADPDRLINPGDSGGGVFLADRLVGNTWSIDLNQAGQAVGAFNVALIPAQVNK